MINIRARTIVGLTEEIRVCGRLGCRKILARIDSGATHSSIDERLVEELKLGPTTSTKIIRSAHGNSVRPLIEFKFEIKDREIMSFFTVADRSHMKYKALIGQNVLKNGFLIDPSKK